MKPTILIDRREQLPWGFPADTFDVQPATLPTGDYSLLGFDQDVVIERKSTADLVSTLIHGRNRFIHELSRLAMFKTAIIAAECDAADIEAHRYESDAAPASVLGMCASCFLDYGVPVMFWSNRQQCEKMAAQFLRLYFKRHAAELVHAA